MFTKFLIKDTIIDFDEPLHIEKLGKGRRGVIFINPTTDTSLLETNPSVNDSINLNLYPLVRSTTCFNEPSKQFRKNHHSLIQMIQKHIPDFKSNNIMMELYDNTYKTMKFHSDQALDLDPQSYIALYSCYQNPRTVHLRILEIQNKKSKEVTQILLENQSVVVWSVQTNSLYLHRIILPQKDEKKDEEKEKEKNDEEEENGGLWCGLTLRQSKTFLYYENGHEVRFRNGGLLSLASVNQAKEFYHLRKLENNLNDTFIWPKIDYTISNSDLLVPI